MVSLGSFDYTLTIANQQALQALTAVQQQAKATQAALQGGSNQFVLKTDQATVALGSLTRAATAAASAISKPINVQVNTTQAQSALQKFGGSVASGLGFGGGAAIAVKGIDLVTDALKGAIEGGLKYNAQLETATQTLKLFTGSSEKAEQALQTLRKYADFTPFDTDEVIRGGQAFITTTNGDIAQMEKLIHLAGQLAATNPDTSQGGGFGGATIALREALSGDTQSIADRFRISRATIQSFKDAGLSGIELAEALVKAAHGSEELVQTLSTTATGQLSNFRSAMANLGQTATKEFFEVLSKGLKDANSELGTNAAAWNNWAKSVGHSLGEAGSGFLQFIRDSGAEFKAIADAIKFIEDHAPKNPLPQMGRDFVDSITNGPLSRIGVGGLDVSDILVGPRRDRTAGQNAGAGTGEPPARGGIPSSTPGAEGARADTLADQAAATKRKAIAEQLAKDLKDIEASTSSDAIRNIDDQTKAVREGASKQKDALQDVRDSAIKAADQRRDAVLAGIDAEQQATSRARTLQDRAISDSNQAVLDGLERAHRTTLDGLDQEKTKIQDRGRVALRDIDEQIDGVNKKKDAALRALDEESRAESRRHSEALRNIDQELNRKLGVIDKQLDALNAQSEKLSRAETDRSLSRSLNDARNDLKNAKTKEERQRAQRAIDDAQHAIDVERQRRAIQDQQQNLRNQQEAARLAAQQKKDTEGELNQTNTQGIAVKKEGVTDQAKADVDRLQDIKDRIKEQTDIEAKAIDDRVKAENAGYDQSVKDQQAAFQAQQRALDDQRYYEDRAFEARKNNAKASYDAEVEAAKSAYDDQSKALTTATDATIADLERQKRAWTLWKEHIAQQIKEAGDNPDKLKAIDLSPPPGTTGTQNAGLGGGEPPSRGEAAQHANSGMGFIGPPAPDDYVFVTPEIEQKAAQAGADLGTSVTTGLNAGIAAGQEATGAAVDEFFQTWVIDRATGVLRAGSPSQAFVDLGKSVTDGVILGFDGPSVGTAIGAPFVEAQATTLPGFEAAMSTTGGNAHTNFIGGYDGPGVNLAIMSPFNQFFDTDTSYLYAGFKGVGEESANSMVKGWVGRNPGDAIYKDGVLDLIKDFQNPALFANWARIGENWAQSLINGFTVKMQDWKPFGDNSSGPNSNSQGSSSGSNDSGGLDLGDPIGQHAAGGRTHGWALVGERGPELVNMSGEVLPADVSRNLSAVAAGHTGMGGGGGSYQFGDINITIDGADQEAAQIISKAGPSIVQHVVQLLDASFRDTAQRMDRSLPGAD